MAHEQTTNEPSPIELRQRVVMERGARSVRTVSEGLISNTRWSAWEAGKQPLTSGIRRAVATAFDWDNDWPENPPVAPVGALESLQADVKQLIAAVGELSSLVRQDLENR